MVSSENGGLRSSRIKLNKNMVGSGLADGGFPPHPGPSPASSPKRLRERRVSSPLPRWEGLGEGEDCAQLQSWSRRTPKLDAYGLWSTQSWDDVTRRVIARPALWAEAIPNSLITDHFAVAGCAAPMLLLHRCCPNPTNSGSPCQVLLALVSMAATPRTSPPNI